jgi:hypothetical protein
MPAYIALLTEWGGTTQPLALPIDDPMDVHTIEPLVAYSGGGNFLNIVGQNLPVTTMWCRFGDRHSPAEVDPFSRQTKARCMVPPSIEMTTTIQVVSTADKPMSLMLNFTYRAEAQIHSIHPRTYIPFRYTDKGFMVDLHGVDFIESDDCKVRFGDYESPVTVVQSSTLIQTTLPFVPHNTSVPVNLFCTGDRLMATGKDTLRFRFTHLPRVDAVTPEEVEAQGSDWVTLSGDLFEEMQGRRRKNEKKRA